MSDFSHVPETPRGWVKTTLGAIRKSYSGSVNPEDHAATQFEHYSVPSFDGGKPVIEKGSDIGSTKKVVEKDMVLLCKINPRINRAWRVRDYSENQKIGSTEWIRFPRVEGVDPDYLRLYMSQSAFRNYLALNASGAGGSLMRVNKGVVDKHPFLVPSLSEQRRIVAKIEELFTNLDAGQSDLATAEQQLERYRLSVLQAAVEGRLTADWRPTHDPEPADQLLERILEERRKQWEEHYRWSRYDSKGKEPPSGWKDRYDERETPKVDDVSIELPESWTWTSADQIGRVETGSTPKTSVDEYYGGKYPFYRPGDLEAGLNVTEAEKTLTDKGLKEARPLPEKSTLITCIGATIGKTGLIRTRGASNQQINAIIPPPSVVPEYVYYVTNSPFFQTLINQRASATTMPILNKGRTKTMPFPLPPLAEQKQIVDEVERLLSVADDAAATAEREQTRAERLRQSILKQAFSGRLVPHEEDATPPSVDGAASEQSDSDASNGRDSHVEDLLGSTDPDKQIEMDL